MTFTFQEQKQIYLFKTHIKLILCPKSNNFTLLPSPPSIPIQPNPCEITKFNPIYLSQFIGSQQYLSQSSWGSQNSTQNAWNSCTIVNPIYMRRTRSMRDPPNSIKSTRDPLSGDTKVNQTYFTIILKIASNQIK